MKQFSFGMLSLQAILFFILTRICTSLHTLNTGHCLRNGETLVSPGQIYELGFFSLSDPNTNYLGIWYTKISPRTIIWVANRETPLSNSPGSLKITSQGNLVLVDITNHVIWSSNSSFTGAKDPVAMLLDSGNFVVREGNDSNPDKFLWQSFDFPVDTLVPGLRIGRNLVTGKETYLSSWKSMDDPSPGKFSMRLDLRGYPQLIVKRGNRTIVRTGSWNGLRLSATPNFDPFVVNKLVQNEQEVFYTYEVRNSTLLLRSRIDPSGSIQRLLWNKQDDYWYLLASAPVDECSKYAFCGAYASCEANNVSRCGCLEGFIPKNPEDWNMQIWSGGCVPKTQINCDGKVGFLKHTTRKLPETSSCWYNKSIGLQECKSLCLENCSCTAYANLDVTNGGSGCLLWFVGLIDIRGGDDGQDIFIKIDGSEIARIEAEKSSDKEKAGIAAGVVAMVISTVTIFCLLRRNLKKQGFKLDENSDEIELPKFDFAIIADATNNFSSDNKLGEGGFGPVYKGIMKGGKEIAVKRLSRGSSQGSSEFKNEVILIAKLQHRNLVKLLGCCIHEDEKMLIYEYMPNKSLDTFIFDQTKSRFLDWEKRINIICGIARGLLYLHQDSRLRIIHRDLKTSNILLDRDLNPKISDFGIARTFWEDQTQDITKRVAGTFGYMSPEYAAFGLFSMKSDVFSFGVMVLEIVSGKKNTGLCHLEQSLINLLGYAWMLWSKGLVLKLIDECLTDSCTESKFVRCINVALLCVQQRPEDRPSMSSVVVMLSSEISLPEPKEPGFCLQTTASRANQQHRSYSANTVTTSDLEAR